MVQETSACSPSFPPEPGPVAQLRTRFDARRATFFGCADDQVATVCAQLAALPDLTDRTRNPSRRFDAIGFSQGGQFLRAVVERCNGVGLGGVTVRNLITLGSQHVRSPSSLHGGNPH